MYQLAMHVWNEIAAKTKLQHLPWSHLFGLEPMALIAALVKLEEKIDAQVKDATVTRAYLLTAPLLAENQAISQFVELTQDPGLRVALPELTTISEAVALATAEFRLMAHQQTKLRELLRDDHRSPAN
jgi:hypothetical protein